MRRSDVVQMYESGIQSKCTAPVNIRQDSNTENSQYAMNLSVVCYFSAWSHWRLKPLLQRVIILSILDAQNVCPCCANHVIVKVKVKFTLEQATKVQRGSRGIAVLFLQPRR